MSHLTYGWPLRLVNPGLGAKTVAEETGVRTERGAPRRKMGPGRLGGGVVVGRSEKRRNAFATAPPMDPLAPVTRTGHLAHGEV